MASIKGPGGGGFISRMRSLLKGTAAEKKNAPHADNKGRKMSWFANKKLERQTKKLSGKVGQFREFATKRLGSIDSAKVKDLTDSQIQSTLKEGLKDGSITFTRNPTTEDVQNILLQAAEKNTNAPAPQPAIPDPTTPREQAPPPPVKAHPPRPTRPAPKLPPKSAAVKQEKTVGISANKSKELQGKGKLLKAVAKEALKHESVKTEIAKELHGKEQLGNIDAAYSHSEVYQVDSDELMQAIQDNPKLMAKINDGKEISKADIKEALMGALENRGASRTPLGKVLVQGGIVNEFKEFMDMAGERLALLEAKPSLGNSERAEVASLKDLLSTDKIELATAIINDPGKLKTFKQSSASVRLDNHGDFLKARDKFTTMKAAVEGMQFSPDTAGRPMARFGEIIMDRTNAFIEGFNADKDTEYTKVQNKLKTATDVNVRGTIERDAKLIQDNKIGHQLSAADIQDLEKTLTDLASPEIKARIEVLISSIESGNVEPADIAELNALLLETADVLNQKNTGYVMTEISTAIAGLTDLDPKSKSFIGGQVASFIASTELYAEGLATKDLTTENLPNIKQAFMAFCERKKPEGVTIPTNL